MITRRQWLLGSAAFALAFPPKSAFARGRTHYGGSVILHAPWPLGWVDPHRIDDPVAAFFGEALFDTLYARDAGGTIVPSLAEADPVVDGSTLRVDVRQGVRFASGAPLDPRVVAASLARSRARDGGPWLLDVPVPRVDGAALVFATRDAHRLAHALASPLVAVLPPRFSPERPDGTGPFRAEVRPGALVLLRNIVAANGPAFLESIEVRRAADLAGPLRAFESGADDLGWLGSFLHEPRPGARAFDGGAVAWVLLRTGRDAGAQDVPGGAQAIADCVPHAAIASFVVGAPWEVRDSTRAGWTGPPCDLLVREDAPWLVELARSLAAALSSPSHEVTPRPLPWTEMLQRRAARAYTLMVDVARPAGPGPLGTVLGLATADDRASGEALARHPPRGELPPRAATRTSRVGVVGEVRLQGGRAPDVTLPPSPWGRGIDWGGASRSRA